MKKKKLILFGTAALAFGVGASVLAFNSGVRSSLLKGWATDHSTTRSLTVTASDIAGAIGAGTSGNFTVGGLEWRVENASVEDGVVTINQGILYNVTFAGATTTVDNWTGTGFTSISVANYTAKAGVSVQLRNLDDFTHTNLALGAETRNPYDLDFAGATDSINRVFLAFGGGDISFTSITYNYGCGVATPSVSISGTADSVNTGESITLTAKVKYGNTSTLVWSADSEDVSLTPSENKLSCTVTGVNANAEVKIKCSMTVDEVVYESNEYSVEVISSSSLTYHDLTIATTSNLEGAGVDIIFDNSVTNLSVGKGDLDKISVTVEFDGGTHFKGYEAANNGDVFNKDTLQNQSGSNITLHGTVPNGFPNDDDFVHTFKVSITIGTDVYEGYVTIQGNKTVTKTGGSWHLL